MTETGPGELTIDLDLDLTDWWMVAYYDGYVVFDGDLRERQPPRFQPGTYIRVGKDAYYSLGAFLAMKYFGCGRMQ